MTFDRVILGPYTADFTRNTITRGKSVIRISPKSMAVLAQLVQCHGRTLTRAEIHDQVWHGQIRSEDVLNQAIRELRRAFSDDRRSARFIATVSGVGYQLMICSRPVTKTSTALTKPETKGVRRSLATVFGLAVSLALAALMVIQVTPDLIDSRRAVAPNPTDQGLLLSVSYSGMDFDGVLWAKELEHELLSSLAGIKDHYIVSAANWPAQQIKTSNVIYGAQKAVISTIEPRESGFTLSIGLLDTKNGNFLWSRKYEMPLPPDKELQRTIASHVTQSLGVEFDKLCLDYLLGKNQLDEASS